MLLAFHLILSAYGFWLPNDPRGSWSDVVREYHLLQFGEATRVRTRQSLAHRPHDQAARLTAKEALRYPPVHFTGEQARAIARGFTIAAAEHGYRIHALAILPDHSHLVLAHHPRPIHQIAAHLKAKATRQLTLEGLHPMENTASDDGRKPSPWARNYWSTFIFERKHLRAAVRYAERNPAMAGLPRQRWKCVVPLEGAAKPRR